MYEPHITPPLSRGQFLWRAFGHFLAALTVLVVSIAIGMTGYLHYEPTLSWRDAFLNTTMLLGGMGPVDAPKTDAGKVFAGCYALYAGLIFIVIASVIVAPLLHRRLHRLHWPDDV